MSKAARERLVQGLVVAVWVALQLYWYGLSVRALIGVAMLVVMMVLSEQFAPRLRSSWRGYLRVAAVSAYVGLLLFSPFWNWFVFLFWAAGTGFGLFWFWYWERAEPAPGKL